MPKLQRLLHHQSLVPNLAGLPRQKVRRSKQIPKLSKKRSQLRANRIKKGKLLNQSGRLNLSSKKNQLVKMKVVESVVDYLRNFLHQSGHYHGKEGKQLKWIHW